MLSEGVVSAFFQAGITGAGLVLAIYALVAPLSRRMLIQRAKALQHMERRFQEQRDKLTPEASDKEFKRLTKLRQQIRETRGFPKYLSIGVILTFVCFMFMAFVAGSWLYNVNNRTPDVELFIAVLVVASWTGFLFLGALTIADVGLTMKREYDAIKKKLEETGTQE